jgi:L-rhamnonate dehydratase
MVTPARITRITTRVAPYSSSTWLDHARLATPMAHVERFAASRSSWRGPGSDVCWVLVETDAAGIIGLGQCRGGVVAQALIEAHLAPLIVGQDARDVRGRLDEMQYAVLPYADGAVGAMAVGAVELALWDAAAHAAEVPLATLLGGSPRELPFYLTCQSAETLDAVPSGLRAAARFVKIPARFGPSDDDGVARTVADLAELRARVPDDVGIAIDSWMSWDVPFAIRVAQGAADLGLAWIEEPLRPDDIAGYRELSRALGATSTAAGEHVYGIRHGLDFVRRSGVRVFQPDVTWCGGLHASLVLAQAARSGNVRYAPHAAGLQPWARHLLAAQGADVLAELLVGVGSEAAAATAPRAEDVIGIGLDPADAGFS